MSVLMGLGRQMNKFEQVFSDFHEMSLVELGGLRSHVVGIRVQ